MENKHKKDTVRFMDFMSPGNVTEAPYALNSYAVFTHKYFYFSIYQTLVFYFISMNPCAI